MSEVKWNDGGASKDDFTAKVNGYVLRAEQINKRTWWWQVYYPDGSEANPDCDLDLPSERVAKSICEIIYRLHTTTCIRHCRAKAAYT